MAEALLLCGSWKVMQDLPFGSARVFVSHSRIGLARVDYWRDASAPQRTYSPGEQLAITGLAALCTSSGSFRNTVSTSSALPGACLDAKWRPGYTKTSSSHSNIHAFRCPTPMTRLRFSSVSLFGPCQWSKGRHTDSRCKRQTVLVIG